MHDNEVRCAQHYLRFFGAAEIAAISQVIDRITAQRTLFIKQWHELYASHFGAHRAYSEQLFREAYVPYLRGAVVRMANADADGFVGSARALGEHLGSTGVPFAVLVAHLSLLKESCVMVLADQPGGVPPTLLLTIDKLAACCISAAADSYYVTSQPAAPAATPSDVRGRIPSAPAAAQSSVFQGMVGCSSVMQRVFAQIRRVALSDPASPVLIIGETGTGKELVARAVHHCGPRQSGPFVAVNCAALPRELIESELFGYKRGAFSGALTDHLGLFRAAAGGTLLLDEITEMGLDLQAKLLRVLQERTVRPVGSVTEVPLDLRIIASSNRDPEVAMEAGVLRPDLYYRLCVTKIAVPALRERPEDIMPLVAHYLGVLNQRFGRTVAGVRGVTPHAIDVLCQRGWRGNVRELFNVLEDAYASCASPHIGIADLAPMREATAAARNDTQQPVQQTLAESERALITNTLASTGGNKLRAAQQLGISRKKLYAKLAKYTL